MTTDLPTMYAAVCAKRPELAVVFDRGEGCTQRLVYVHGGWQLETYYGEERQCIDFVLEETAAALILARWVEALPQHHELNHLVDRETARWCVSGIHSNCAVRDTPIAALAAFYLGETA